MEKAVSILKKVTVFLLALVVVLCIGNHYYELCNTDFLIRDLIFILFCICVIMSVFLLSVKKGLCIKVISGALALAFLFVIGAVYDYNSLGTQDYTVYTDKDYSVVVRINQALFSNKMSVYIKTDPYIMKRADVDIDLVFPPDYDPFLEGDYQVEKDGSTLILKTRIDIQTNEYREFIIKV